MARIKTVPKLECRNSDGLQYMCQDEWEQVPIRDWSLSTQNIEVKWRETTPLPQPVKFTVVYPELEALEEYKNKVKNWRWNALVKSPSGYTPPDVITLRDENVVSSYGTKLYHVSFKNFHLLKEEVTTIQIHFEVTGDVTENGTTVNRVVESRVVYIKITKTDKDAVPSISADKREYQVNYTKTTKEITADTIRLQVSHLDNYSGRMSLIALNNEFSAISASVTNGITPTLSLNTPQTWHHFTEGTHRIDAKVRLQGNDFTLETPVVVALTVRNYTTGFEVDASDFVFDFIYRENKQGTGTIHISNPNHLQFTIEKNDWITTQYASNVLTFTTKSAQQLGVGRTVGNIRIQSGSYIKIIRVEVNVRKTVETNLTNDIHFCLDPHHISVKRKSEQGEYLRVNLTMSFRDSLLNVASTISQSYEYVFSKNEVVFTPGRNVQDFFQEMKQIETLNILSESIKIQPLFSVCSVGIIIEEISPTQEVTNTENIGTFLFLPGKRPKGYPFLTNVTKRRTFTDSLVSVSALQSDFTKYQLHTLVREGVNVANIVNETNTVVHMCFRRSEADKYFKDRDILEKESLQLIPFPDETPSIPLIFVNQNFCPDWFTFAPDWQREDEFEHTLSEHLQHGEYFKADVKRNSILKLNTGWILKEEAPLIHEIIASPVCFAYIEKQWLKLIATSKKSISEDNFNNVKNFTIEFKIIN